jgi:hypothetical protein
MYTIRSFPTKLVRFRVPPTHALFVSPEAPFNFFPLCSCLSILFHNTYPNTFSMSSQSSVSRSLSSPLRRRRYTASRESAGRNSMASAHSQQNQYPRENQFDDTAIRHDLFLRLFLEGGCNHLSSTTSSSKKNHKINETCCSPLNR